MSGRIRRIRRISLSRAIGTATVVLLVVSCVLCVPWYLTVRPGNSEYEPAVEGVGFIGALIGLVAERRVKAREVRRQALSTIVDELIKNRGVLADRAFRSRAMRPGIPQLYPRLHHSAVDAAFATGAVLDLGDPEAASLLHRWRDDVTEFNRRLDLTELREVIVGERREFHDLHAALTRPNGWHAVLVGELDELHAYLTSTFAEELAEHRGLLHRRTGG